MTPEKYKRLKSMIDDLLPARQWLREQMFAEGQKKTFLDILFKTPEEVFISRRAAIGAGTIIHGAVSIRGETVIGQNCVIEQAHLTNARLGDYVFVGPFAQISESDIGVGTDIPHHSYVGNASVGKYCNIGDAVTTSNFDGIRKRQTVIEDGCFIGTQMKIVPPVRIGRESFVAVRELKRDIPPYSFVVQGIFARDGRIQFAEIVKPNRSFQLMPGKWLWTRRPIAPDLMRELREKIADIIPAAQRLEFYEKPRAVFQGRTALEAIKCDGEEAVRELIALLDGSERDISS